MRNLKRALSLTLASVMLLGMMVVGAGAAGYPDVDSEDNVEAIEVIQAVGVMVGDDNGNFNPDDQVTRAQMAVILAKLMNLNTYITGTNPFPDVTQDWAIPSISACYVRGYLSGYDNGNFGPNDPVTAVQAASMLMRVVGYFKYPSDYKDGFEVATVRQAGKIELFENVDTTKASDPLTRNQVAQLILNALKTPTVEPDDNTINITDQDGRLVVTGGQVNYVVVASKQNYAQAIDSTEYVGNGLNQVSGYTVELGEKLYAGKLELRDNGQDDFGRPARTWLNNGSEIGSYAKKELLVKDYQDEVKGSEIYELLGQTAIRDNTLEAYLDGAVNTGISRNNLVRANNSKLNGTGRGVLTEVYLDNDLNTLTIVSINTYLAKANVDYSEASESITLTVYYGDNQTSSKRVDMEDVPYIANLKKDDWCLVQWNGSTLNGVNDKVIASAFDVEIREDQKVTGFGRSSTEHNGTGTGNAGRVNELTIAGEKIKNNEKAYYKHNTLNDFNNNELVNKTYTVYMDQYGNFIGVELYSGNNQYVFITGYDRTASNISVNTVKASAIFTDGTMAAINVNTKDTDENIKAYNDTAANHASNPAVETGGGANRNYVRWSVRNGGGGNNLENMWYKYTVYKDVYTLSPVDGYTRETNTGGTDKIINCSNVYLAPTTAKDSSPTTPEVYGSRSFGEDASVYITVDKGDVDTSIGGNAITEVTGLYTGVQDVKLAVPTNQWIHAVWEDNYIVAAIVWGEAEGAVDNYAYIRDGIKKEWTESAETKDGSDVVHFWEFDVVIKGETATMTAKSRFTNTIRALKPGTVQELILDADGYVTRIKDVADANTYTNKDYNADSGNNQSLKGQDVYFIMTRANQYVNTGSAVNTSSDFAGVALSDRNSDNKSIDLSFKGNTLSYKAGSTDIGLPVLRDAKAVVSQRVDQSNTWENYSSVEAAYNALNDADEDSDGKQFDGSVIAVLDSNGVAAWVLFIDNTPTLGKQVTYPDTRLDVINNNDGITGLTINGRSFTDYATNGTSSYNIAGGASISLNVKSGFNAIVSGNVGSVGHTEGSNYYTFTAPAVGNTMTIRVQRGTGTRTFTDASTTVESVNAELFDGNDVVIDLNGATWTPNGTTEKTIIIPAGRTLTVKGAMNAKTNEIKIDAGNDGAGKLIVSGTLSMSQKNDDIDFELETRNLILTCEAPGTISITKPVTVHNEMKLANTSTGITLKVYATTNVEGQLVAALKSADSTKIHKLETYATMTVKQAGTSSNPSIIGFADIKELAGSTLIAGAIKSCGTIQVGDSSHKGRIVGMIVDCDKFKPINGELDAKGSLDAASVDLSALEDFTVKIDNGATVSAEVKGKITGESGSGSENSESAGGTFSTATKANDETSSDGTFGAGTGSGSTGTTSAQKPAVMNTVAYPGNGQDKDKTAFFESIKAIVNNVYVMNKAFAAWLNGDGAAEGGTIPADESTCLVFFFTPTSTEESYTFTLTERATDTKVFEETKEQSGSKAWFDIDQTALTATADAAQNGRTQLNTGYVYDYTIVKGSDTIESGSFIATAGQEAADETVP